MFSHEEVISLFNYTSTFKRQSDYPLSTQHLPNLDYLLVSTYTTLTTRHKTTFFDLYIYGLEIDILQSVETLNPYWQKLRALKEACTYNMYLSITYSHMHLHQYMCGFNFVVGQSVRRGHGDEVSAEEVGEPGPCSVRPEWLWCPVRQGRVCQAPPAVHPCRLVREVSAQQGLTRTVNIL